VRLELDGAGSWLVSVHGGKVAVEIGFVSVVGDEYHLKLLGCSVTLVPSA
jgi:hypothetical protein